MPRSGELETAQHQIAALQAELAITRSAAQRERQEAERQLAEERARAAEELKRAREEAEASASAALEESRQELEQSRCRGGGGHNTGLRSPAAGASVLRFEAEAQGLKQTSAEPSSVKQAARVSIEL